MTLQELRQFLTTFDYGRWRDQPIGVENALLGSEQIQSARTFADVENFLAQKIGLPVEKGGLIENPQYVEAHQTLRQKYWQYAVGIIPVVGRLNAGCWAKRQPITIENLERVLQDILAKEPNFIPRSEAWGEHLQQKQNEQQARREATAQGRAASALEAELLAAKREELNKGRVKLTKPTMGEALWAQKADQRIADLLEKESTRLANLSFEELQAEKSQLDAKKDQEKASKQYVPGSRPAPTQYKPIPPDYHGEPWSMKLLSRLGGIGTGPDNRLRRVIREWGADQINAAVRANTEKGVS